MEGVQFVYLALAVALPTLTVRQYRTYGEQPKDVGAIRAGVASKRWLAENLLALLYALSNLIAAAVALWTNQYVPGFSGWPWWLHLVWTFVWVSTSAPMGPTGANCPKK